MSLFQAVCPLLLSPETYQVDTINLLEDDVERAYWLPCLEQMVKKFVGRAEALNPGNTMAKQKAQLCYEEFHKLVEELTVNPARMKPLSVRTLLEFNEDNLRKNQFEDAWKVQKQKETDRALEELKTRLEFIDKIDGFDERWLELIKGVLAGNVFDWGAKAVSDILETSQDFGLDQALGTIEQRPWFRDDAEEFIKANKDKFYKKALIFVDNAGVDFVLGILPLVRQFLLQNTKVVIAANTLPSLNDVTYKELNAYCCQAAQTCDILKGAIAAGRLITVANGQKGPCLDLSNLSKELCDLMADVDLIILEGMARAVHTNLNTKFKVDSIKVAVLKNEWLAKRLGAKQFSVVFKFEQVKH